MLHTFKMLNPKEIYFGKGEISRLPGLIRRFGKRVLLVTGSASFKSSSQWDLLQSAFQEAQITCKDVSVKTEPSPELVNQLAQTAREEKPDVILAIGGGSVLDTGKAVSAMFFCPEPVENYLEGIGDKIHPGSKLPFIAVPTTSGTGSEATKNAVLSKSGKNGFKKSLRHDNFVPDITVVDPALTLSCPGSITAYCGMDAFTQLLESYLSTNASIMTDSLAYEGLGCIKEALISACEDKGTDIDTRARLSYGALVSGITLANAGLGTVHGFASAIGGLFSIPHGLICGTLMAETNKFTINKLLAEDKTNIAVSKFAKIGRLFSGTTGEGDNEYYCQALINTIENWLERLEIPRLGTFGITTSDVDRIIAKTGNKNNPALLTKEELGEIIINRL